MKQKRVLLTLIMAVMLLLCMTVTAFADGNHIITSTEDLDAALNEIRTAGSGTYTLSLQADVSGKAITVNGDANVTIIGNGHTITFSGEQKIVASGNAVINLGDKNDPSNKLTLTNSSTKIGSSSGAVALTNNATVNMYDGVTMKDVTGDNYLGGAVIIGATTNQPNTATFHMYGGLIDNCGIASGSVSFGGAVSVTNGGTFIMDGGAITNCYAKSTYNAPNGWQVPTATGGAVFVYNSTFVMNGGIIDGCHADYDGGAVAVINSRKSASSGFGYLDSHFEMNGGTISNCTAEYVGGGVAVLGTYVDILPICTNSSQTVTMNTPGVFINGGVIKNNEAENGGGFFAHWIRDTVPVQVKNVEFTGNRASEGAAIDILSYYTAATIENCTITNNTAAGVGGGIALNGTQGAKTTINSSVIANNKADEYAADIYVYDSVVSLFDAANMGETYYGGPSDLTGRTITKWYYDNEGDRFEAQEEDARAELATLNIARSTEEVSIIAAPDADAPYGSSDQVFKITKDFLYADGYINAGEKIADTTGLFSATANPVISISPLSSYNRQEGRDQIPEFGGPYTVNASEGIDYIEVSVPDYSTAGVGDYWYTVTETVTNTAGITYDVTNPRYMHVQVMWADNERTGISVNVMLHSTAPDAEGNYVNNEDDKGTGFENKYGAGDLSVTKKLDGNMADKTKFFKVTVVLAAPEGKVVYSNATYTGGWADETGTIPYSNESIEAGWTGEKTFEVWLKGDSTITFANLPDGVTYSIKEDDYSDDGYTTSYSANSTSTADGETASDDGVTGKIADNSDKVTVTNTKEATVDVGVILDNAPYILLAVIGCAAVVLMLVKNKKRKDYDM